MQIANITTIGLSQFYRGYVMKPMVRHAGKWHVVEPRPYEPPRVTWNVVWKQLNGMTQTDAYRAYYAEQRDISKVLYLNKKNGQ